MLRTEIPVNIIKLVWMTMDNTSANVKVGNKLNEPFHFNDGVKQGGTLSTTLFNTALHSVINKIDQKETLFLKSTQICAYADDLVIVTRYVNILKQIYLQLEGHIQSTGLSVNEKKTKSMTVAKSKARRWPQNLLVGGKNSEGILDFTYLEALINRNMCRS
ncbi:hypothetical protein Cfor_11047, partial [Coptotermes formosanus]